MQEEQPPPLEQAVAVVVEQESETVDAEAAHPAQLHQADLEQAAAVAVAAMVFPVLPAEMASSLSIKESVLHKGGFYADLCNAFTKQSHRHSDRSGE